MNPATKVLSEINEAASLTSRNEKSLDCESDEDRAMYAEEKEGEHGN